MPTSVLTNLERRVIANLSIPRNTLDLAATIRSDFHANTPTFDPEQILPGLAELGWVVKLGSRFDTPGELAAKVDSHRKARSMPDEKARIYEARLKVAHRAWRSMGEQWIMTDEGFDKLHDPEGIGDPAPLATSEVERRIAEQWQRIHRGETTDTTRLSSDEHDNCVMLEDEFIAWAKQLAKDHHALTGDKLKLPVGGGAGYADATETLVIDAEDGKASYTETAPWYMAATTVAVTDADTGTTITEANYTGYARKSVAAADMNAAASPGGSATNANAITFAACTAGTSAVIGFAKCVAATVGRLIKYGACSTVNVSSTQQPLSFAVAAFSTALD